MRPAVGTTLIMAGAGVGMVGALAYVSGIQVQLSPALVSLLLAKATFAAAGGLMVAGAVLRRRALQRRPTDRERLDRRSEGFLAAGLDRPVPDASSGSMPGVREDEHSPKVLRPIDGE
ncbi:MAG: hypothetical protein M3068_01965 [Gemmatimonadota bacterium]|nr:hypothetical protein [Gemmatimonadota bacterium]